MRSHRVILAVRGRYWLDAYFMSDKGSGRTWESFNNITFNVKIVASSDVRGSMCVCVCAFLFLPCIQFWLLDSFFFFLGEMGGGRSCYDFHVLSNNIFLRFCFLILLQLSHHLNSMRVFYSLLVYIISTCVSFLCFSAQARVTSLAPSQCALKYLRFRYSDEAFMAYEGVLRQKLPWKRRSYSKMVTAGLSETSWWTLPM